MNSKAQVTVFVIVGLIILAVVILAFTLLQTSQEPSEADIIEKYRTDYASDIVPLQKDVESCLARLGEDSIREMGLHGGFMEKYTQNIITDKVPSHLNTGVEMFEDSGWKIPYWNHIQSNPDCTTCVTDINIPLLDSNSPLSMKNQIQEHIDENIVACVDSFNAYKNDYSVVFGEPKSEVVITQNGVFIGLNWQIELSRGIDRFSLDKFSTNLDVRLRDMYELAVGLLFQTEMVKGQRRLETFTTDILQYMSLNGEYSEIPPADGPTVTGFTAPKYWDLRETKNKVSNQVAENIPFVQVEGSYDAYYLFTENAYENNFYSNMQIPYLNEYPYFKLTRIRFNYMPNWPMYLQTNPGFGTIAMPESIYQSLFIITLVTQKYNFKYDITYPVVITLEDETSFNGEGFVFQYAYEVNVRRNKPYSDVTIVPELEELRNNQGSFGSPDQRTVDVSLKLVNGYTLAPIKDIPVAYECVDSFAMLGVSELKDGQTYVDGKLPPCVTGNFVILTRDYYAEDLVATLNVDTGYSATILVYPKKTMDVVFRKKMLFTPDPYPLSVEDIQRTWKLDLSNTVLFPDPDENIMLLITRIQNGVETDDVQAISVTLDSTEGEIALVPSEYKVNLFSYVNFGPNGTRPKHIVPEKTYQAGGFLGWGEEDVTIPTLEFNDTTLIGALTLDNTTGYMVVTRDDLMSANKLVVTYAAYNPLDIKIGTDFSVLGYALNASLQYPEAFVVNFE